MESSQKKMPELSQDRAPTIGQNQPLESSRARGPESGQRNALDSMFSQEEVGEVLQDTFYKAPTKARPKRKLKAEKPTHYEVICISLYKEDLKRLDAMVSSLKERGHRKMSRSGLIRFALDHVDLDSLPRSY